MITKRGRAALFAALAAATLGASLTASQLPAGASGGNTKPTAPACSHPAPKDVKAAQKAKGATPGGAAEAKLKERKLQAELAGGKPPKGGKPAEGGKPDVDKRCKDDHKGIDLKALSEKFDIPVDRLEAGLVAAKRAGGGAASVDAFAQAAGVSKQKAAAVVAAVFGDEENQDEARKQAAKVLAAALGVSPAAMEKALERLNQADGIEPGSALFRSVAHDLGVTPQRLQEALVAFKQGSKG
jgi:hypothetical protein